MFFSRRKPEMPTAETALKGRDQPIPTAATHFINGRPLKGPYPEGTETAEEILGHRKGWCGRPCRLRPDRGDQRPCLAGQQVELEQQIEVQQHEQSGGDEVEADDRQVDVEQRELHRRAAQQVLVRRGGDGGDEIGGEGAEPQEGAADLAGSFLE